MLIDNIEVSVLSEWDGKPVKNKLPAELRDRLKTEKQWLEAGYLIKHGGVAFDLHPNMMAKSLCVYYLDSDTEMITAENTPKNCMTCSIRRGRFCVVAGDYVSSKNCCSEWEFGVGR